VTLAEKLDTLPTRPGVYLFKGREGEILYVGKARVLRDRVRSYFQGSRPVEVHKSGMVEEIADLDLVVTDTEMEALALENNLIKRHKPPYNVRLRDDKNHPYLKLTLAEEYPRLYIVRRPAEDGNAYGGPYIPASLGRKTSGLVRKLFGVRSCKEALNGRRPRPCLQYQIKRCSGPCAFAGLAGAYAEQVEDVKMFLSGKDAELLTRLRGRMAARAEREDFEVAAVLRDSIAAVERTLAKQHIVQDEFVDQDVWGLAREADVAEVVVLFIRGGKLVGRRAFQQKDQELPDVTVIAEHLQQYYATGTLIPDEVVVGVELEDAELLGDWLSSVRGKRVRIVEPRRGIRARLVELADRNAQASAASRHGRDADADALLDKVARRLALPRPPRRIECFDIAHIQGSETVAAMVTFVDGVPARNLYRKFKVRTVDNNDFAAMYEVLTRRFKRAGGTGESGDAGDDAWAPPDLLVIDGGKGQLGMAVAALTDLGVQLGGEGGLEVIGLAKERELDAGSAPDRIYRRTVKDSIPLRPNSPELYVLARIRDEAHRFANTFHRDRRSKATLRSELDAIPGIGTTRRQRLLKQFGSVRAIRQASVDDLARAPGMNRKAAEQIADYFARQAAGEAGDAGDALDEAIDDLTDASAQGAGAATGEPLDGAIDGDATYADPGPTDADDDAPAEPVA